MATQEQKAREEETYYATHLRKDGAAACGNRYAQHLTLNSAYISCPDCKKLEGGK